jgi:hypothetical protein
MGLLKAAQWAGGFMGVKAPVPSGGAEVRTLQLKPAPFKQDHCRFCCCLYARSDGGGRGKNEWIQPPMEPSGVNMDRGRQPPICTIDREGLRKPGSPM